MTTPNTEPKGGDTPRKKDGIQVLDHFRWIMDLIHGKEADGYMYGWQIKEILPEYFKKHKLKATLLYKVE